jgi:hypothetical protein
LVLRYEDKNVSINLSIVQLIKALILTLKNKEEYKLEIEQFIKNSKKIRESFISKLQLATLENKKIIYEELNNYLDQIYLRQTEIQFGTHNPTREQIDIKNY